MIYYDITLRVARTSRPPDGGPEKKGGSDHTEGLEGSDHTEGLGGSDHTEGLEGSDHTEGPER